MLGDKLCKNRQKIIVLLTLRQLLNVGEHGLWQTIPPLGLIAVTKFEHEYLL
jgi:hypothetical protein